MDNQQNAPVLTPVFLDIRHQRLNPIWQKWFQKLKTRDDEVRRRPYKTYTMSQTLTTYELGKAILFDTAVSTVITATLPSVETKDLWSWITIVRVGTGTLKITTSDADKIEREGKIIGCRDPNRLIPNVTLQLVEVDQWAIIGATGVWSVLPF